MELSRRFLRIAGCLALGLPLFASWPRSFAQEDLAAAIAALQRRYAAVDSIRADFTQTYRAPGVDQVESGVVYMRKPGLMRWEYQTPEVKLFIADGRDTYLYTPEDRQVLVQRFTLDDLRSTPIQLLLGGEDARKNYVVAGEPASVARLVGSCVFRLTPRAGQSEYAYVLLECDKLTYDLRRIVIQERTGNISEFLFRNLATNVKVDSRQFQFKVPKGVEVVRLDAK